MKKNLKLLIVSLTAVTILAAGCQSKPASQNQGTTEPTKSTNTTEATSTTVETEPEKKWSNPFGANATVEGQLYTNPDLSLSIQFPDGLDVLDYTGTEERKKELLGIANYNNDQRGRNEYLMDYLVYASNDLISYDLLAYDYEGMMESLGTTTEEDYLVTTAKTLSEQYTEMGIGAEFGEIETRTIGATEYKHVMITLSSGETGKSATQYIFAFIVDDVIAMGTCEPKNEEGIALYEAIVSGISL